MKKLDRVTRGILCTTLGGVCWGISGTCGQYLFSTYHVSSQWFTAVRMLVSGLCFLLLALKSSRPALSGIWRDRRDVLQLVVYGIFGLMLCQYAYMTSISFSNAATTTVLQNLSLVIIMVLSCLQLRRWPGRRQVLALALAAAGTYLVATGGDPRHMVLSRQVLIWGLLTAASVAAYTLIPSRILPKWGKEVISGYGMLIGGAGLCLASRPWRLYVPIPIQGWLAVAAVIVVGTILSFSLFMQGIADIGPVRSAMLATTEPVSATLFSFLCLGTRFSVTDLIGFACIIAMILVLAKTNEEKTPAA